jgi:hypothetical protein
MRVDTGGGSPITTIYRKATGPANSDFNDRGVFQEYNPRS